MDCSLSASFVHGISQARITGVGLPFPFLGDLLDTGIDLESSALVGDSLPLSHLGSPQFGVICYFLIIRLRFCILGKDTTEVKVSSSVYHIRVYMMLIFYW